MASKKQPLKTGIDVSHWQGDIDWKKVKASGIDFVMIKLGGSDSKSGEYYIDEKFNDNYKKAKATGLSVGAYWFTGNKFTSCLRAKLEADYVLSAIKGKYFDYPIAVDIETTYKSDRESATVAAITFCDVLAWDNYYPIIYGSDSSGFKERLNIDRLVRFDKWVARYSSTNSAKVTAAPSYVTNYSMWQYTSKGKVDGIEGNVDLDYSYVDYSDIIKRYGYNGYKAKIQNESKKTLKDVAKEVLEGKWGNGNDLKANLTKAGYVYIVVKNVVDEILYPPEYCED